MKNITVRRLTLIALWLCLCGIIRISGALPYQLGDLPNTHSASPLITPAQVSYDHNSQSLSGNSYLGEDQPGVIFSVTSGLVANDIVGSFLLDAKVDNSGTLDSGTFALIGKSETLGIAPGTALLTATLTDVYYDPTGIGFQVRARVDFVSPALAVHVGVVKSLWINYSVATGDDFFMAPWNASFLESGFTTGPDVFLLDKVLPLTPVENLTEFNLSPSIAPVSAFNHITDVYTIDQTVGPGIPMFLREYPSFSLLASDFSTTLTLVASIDNNGEIYGSSEFSIKGKVSSLGIPEGSTVISGTPVEVKYLSGGFNIQFLIMVDEIHPALVEAVGDINSILLYDNQAVGGSFDANPWNASFTDQAFTSGPDMFLTSQTLMPSDLDGDGIATASDNCQFVSNGDQRDADGDGIGSLCDSDFNNDCTVNFLDLVYLRENFLQADSIADMNGDGIVNFLDASLLTQQFFANFSVDNPGASPNICD